MPPSASVVDCGAPSQATVSHASCTDHTPSGTCNPVCATGYEHSGGGPTAQCNADSGSWTYGTPCVRSMWGGRGVGRDHAIASCTFAPSPERGKPLPSTRKRRPPTHAPGDSLLKRGEHARTPGAGLFLVPCLPYPRGGGVRVCRFQNGGGLLLMGPPPPWGGKSGFVVLRAMFPGPTAPENFVKKGHGGPLLCPPPPPSPVLNFPRWW